MEKLAENDLTYFYLRHVVIVVTTVTTISLPMQSVSITTDAVSSNLDQGEVYNIMC